MVIKLHYPLDVTEWTPNDAGAVAWWDTTLPGGFIVGIGPTSACEGAHYLRDWSGNGHHSIQATAANQGTLDLRAPGGLATGYGGIGFLCDNTNDGWACTDSLNVGTDHTLLCGINILNVPAATPQVGFMNTRIVAGAYQVLGTNSSKLSIVDAAGTHNSNLDVLTGIHAYTAIIDGAGATAMLYRDTTAAVASVVCAAKDCSTGVALATTYVNNSPDGICFRFAYWNRKLTTTEQARAAAWAIRNNG